MPIFSKPCFAEPFSAGRFACGTVNCACVCALRIQRSLCVKLRSTYRMPSSSAFMSVCAIMARVTLSCGRSSR